MPVSSAPLSETHIAGRARAAMSASSSRATRRPGSEVSGTSARHSRLKSSTIVNELRSMKVTPHVAQNTSGRARRRSMAARRAMPATPSASASASKLKKLSVGSRRSPDKSRPSFEDVIASAGPSALRPPPKI